MANGKEVVSTRGDVPGFRVGTIHFDVRSLQARVSVGLDVKFHAENVNVASSDATTAVPRILDSLAPVKFVRIGEPISGEDVILGKIEGSAVACSS